MSLRSRRNVIYSMFLCLLAIMTGCQAALQATASVEVSSPPSGIVTQNCFYDSVEDIVNSLGSKIKELSDNLKTEADPYIQVILNAGNSVSQLECYQDNSDEIPKEIIQNVAGLAKYSNTTDGQNWTFPVYSGEYLNSIQGNRTNAETYLNAFWKALKYDWSFVAESEDYPVSYRANVWMIVEFQRQENLLRCTYKDNLNQCLSTNYIHLASLQKISLENAKISFELVKEGVHDFVLDPVYLTDGGVAITFWVKENLHDFAALGANSTLNVFQGYSANERVYAHTLTKSNSSVLNNLLMAGNTQEVPNNSDCSDFAFVILSFEKDVSQYKMTLVIKFLTENKRFFLQQDVKAHLVENIQFTFFKPLTYEVKLYKGFTYSEDIEISLFNIGTSAAQMEMLTTIVNQCAVKQPNCSYQSENFCVECKPEFIHFNGNCVDQCPSGFFQNQHTCVKCSTGCAECSSLENCKECESPYVLNGSHCHTRCPDDMFPVRKVCQECKDNCEQCHSAGECKICKPDFFLMNGNCVKTCERGYFTEYNPNVCKKCEDSCQECRGIGSCSFCTEGFFLFEGKCIRNCPHGLYNDEGTKTCRTCPQNCKECSIEGTCTTCKEGYTLSSDNRLCTSDCPIATAPLRGICLNCNDKNCESCNSLNVDECFQCNLKSLLKNGKCVESCGENYYLDAETRKCLPCSTDNCITCAKDKCFQCKKGLYVFNDLTCVNGCPAGFIESGSVCLKCKNPGHCRKCSLDNLEVCTECYSNELLLEGKCVRQCPEGYFKNLSNHKCEKCVEGCKNCSSNNVCDVCQDGWFKKGSNCVQNCEGGFTQINGSCVPCSVSGCGKCDSNNLSNCLQCKSGKFLFANKCYDECPAFTFATQTNTCEICNSDCIQCFDSSTCTKCSTFTVLQGNVCKKKCDKGYFDQDGVCEFCSDNYCAACDDNKCLECKNDKVLLDGECVDKCPDYTYLSRGICLPCNWPCVSCKDEKQCNSCVNGYTFNNTTCSDNCPNGSAKVEDKCLNCTAPNCEKCLASALDTCVKCSQNYFLLGANCYSACPLGHYSDNSSQKCLPCMDGCAKCADNSTCEECQEGDFLFESQKCLSSCPYGYSTNKSKVCFKCKNNCKACEEDHTQCTSCPDQFLLYKGDCRVDCPDSTYEKEGQCLSCEVSDCSKCKEGGLCTECSGSLLLKDNTCVKAPCPDGYTQVDRRCVKCEVQNCKSCPSTNTKICSACSLDNFLFLDSSCESSCPPSTFPNHILGKCEKCDTFCESCTDESKCTKCEENFFQMGGKCVRDCPDQYTDVNGECVQCSVENCKVCDSKKETCQKCLLPLLLYDNSCVTQCPDYHYPKDGKCLPCSNFCKKCLNSNTCTLCEINKILSADNKCSDTCPDGYVSLHGNCTKCTTEENCKKCQPQNLDKCEECKGSLVLIESLNKCVENCPEKMYDEQKVCKPCPENCLTCRDSFTCDLCELGFNLQYQDCQAACNKGFYSFSGVCVPCGENCEDCNSDKCIKCSPNFLLENGSCVPKCSKGYFSVNIPENKSNVCTPCGNNCISCANSHQCSICDEGFYLKNGECVEDCGSGYTSKDGICQSCDQGCEICNPYNKKICFKCNSNLALSGNECVRKCPNGTFLNIHTSKCENCIENCILCSNSNKCEKCTSEFNLNKDGEECSKTCDDGYGPVENICKPCTVEHCRSCERSLDVCTECSYPFVNFKNTKCLESCPRGKFTNSATNKCEDCPIGCRTCQDKDTCKSCIENFTFTNNKCLSQCGQGEGLFKGECRKCFTPDCRVCDSSLNICFQCENEKLLSTERDEEGNVTFTDCVNSCGVSQFQSEGKCLNCTTHCNKCNNEYECQECERDYLNQSGKCELRCNSHFVERNGKCVRCEDVNCLECDNLTLKECRSCEKGYSLKNGKCVTDCESSYFSVKVTSENEACRACVSDCKKCSNESTCDECSDGFSLKNGVCVEKCGDGFVQQGKTCIKCQDPNCHLCDPNKPSSCLNCLNPFVLYNQKCFVSCPEKFFADKNKRCIPCQDSNCLKCDNGKCSLCNNNFFIFGGKCVPECPSSYVPDAKKECQLCTDGKCLNLNKSQCNAGHFDKDGQCILCDAKCKQCLSENETDTCIECYSGFYLDETSCVTNCGVGKYEGSNGICALCPSGCESCLNESTCQTCQKGFNMFKGRCVTKCPSNTVGVLGECKNCLNADCVECDTANRLLCTKCPNSKRLFKGECLSQCPDKTFAADEGKTCRGCQARCSSCDNEYTCSKCEDGYVLNSGKCNSTCPEGKVSRNNICYSCANPKCSVCSSTELNKCFECSKGSFLLDATCVETCPEGFRQDTENNKCVECEGECSKCSDKECLKCKTGFYLEDKTSNCVFCEQPNLINTETQTCSRCQISNCLQCSEDDPNKCLSCLSGTILFNGKCLNQCPNSFFSSNQTCEKCPENCNKCHDNKTCTECSNKHFLLNNNCVSSCPEGWTDDHQMKCVKCVQDECSKCDYENLSECVKCKSEAFIHKTTCNRSCPEGTYASLENNTCINCHSTCSECDPNNCKKCKPGYMLKSGECVANCGAGYLDDGKVCNQCTDSNCLECDPVNICSNCKNGTLLTKDGTCVISCPDYSYADSGRCLNCQEGCKKCEKDKCIQCESGLFLENGKCLQNCSEGRTDVNGICIPCSQPECNRCYPEDASKCYSCNKNSAKPYLEAHACVTTCPKRTYASPTSSSLICAPCEKSCDVCDDSGCLKCKDEFNLENGKCINRCPDGKVLYSGKCINCDDEQCKTCLTDTTICIECMTPFKLVGLTCEDKCPNGYFATASLNSQCQQCRTGCKECTEIDKCTNCETGFYLQEGICVRTCRTGYFGDSDNICKPCNESCLECYQSSASECLVCNADYFRNEENKSCVKAQSCPTGTYANIETQQCNKCRLSFCKECTDDITCLSCLRGFQLINGVCEEAKTFVNAYNEPQLYSIYTEKNHHTNEGLSFNDDLKGIAVGDSEVTFIFWLRKLKVSPAGITFLMTDAKDSPLHKIEMKSSLVDNSQEVCEFKVITSTNIETSIKTNIDCTSIGLYNWTYFMINLTKNRDNTAQLRVTVYVNEKFENMSVNIPPDTSEIITKDTRLLFNENNKGDDAYEITKLNIFDYYPSEFEVLNFFNDKPDNCDYSCSNCRGKCIECIIGKPNDDGYCPAGYMPIKPFITSFDQDISFNIRDKLVKRLVSDRYALSLFFYIKNVGEESLNLASLYYDTLLTSNQNSPYSSILNINLVSKKIVINSTMKFDNPEVNANSWYMMLISIKENYISLYLREWNSEKYFKQQSPFKKNVHRIFDDLAVVIGNVYGASSESKRIQGSAFNSRLYLNNIPDENEIERFFNSLESPQNCAQIGEDLDCLACSEGYKLLENGTCVDNTLEERALLLDKISLWNRDSISLNIPESLMKDQFSLSFWLRKKKPSIQVLPKLHSLVSAIAEDYSRIALVTETVQPGYVSDLFFKFGDQFFPTTMDYSNIVPDYILVVINVDLIGKTMEYDVTILEEGVQKVYHHKKEWSTKFSTIAIGDSSGVEMNFEVAQVYYYPKILIEENILKLRGTAPKDCDPACVDCNYDTGVCNVCVQRSAKSFNVEKCALYLKGFTSTYLYNASSYDSIPDAQGWVNNLQEDFKKDVNSMTYSLIGYFKILDFSKFTEIPKNTEASKETQEPTKFQLVSLNNYDHNNPADKYPGRDLITIEISMLNGNSTLNWVVDELDTPKYIPFEPQPNFKTGDWIFVYGGVNVSSKEFKYKWKLGSTISPVVTVILNTFPEKLSERAALKAFGMDNNLPSNYKIPNGQLFEFYVIVNADYQERVFEVFTSTRVPPPNPACKEGCSKCVVDADKNNVCITCNEGYSLVNKECKKTAQQEVGYMILNDSWDELDTGVNYDLSKFDFSNGDDGKANFSFAFYFRRNFYPSTLNAQTVISKFGKMSVSAWVPGEGPDYYISITIEGESNSINLGPLDIDPSVDYKWYAVSIAFNNSRKKISAFLNTTGNDKTAEQKGEMNLINPFKHENTLFLATPEYEMQIYGAHLINSLSNYPVINSPSKYVCPNNCDMCYKETCKVCTYGLNEKPQANSSCFPAMIKLPNKYLSKSTNIDAKYKISNFMGKKQLFRSKKFYILFSFDTNIKTSNDLTRVITFANSNTDKDNKYTINNFFTVYYTTSERKFIIRLGNRFLSSKGKISQFEMKYPYDVKVNSHSIALSLDGDLNILTVVFKNRKDNYVEKIFNFEGLIDYMTQNTNIYLSNYFDNSNVASNEYMSYRDFRFSYSDSKLDLFELSMTLNQFLQNFQDVCPVATRDQCIECPEGKLVDGVCSQSQSTNVFYLNQINQVTYLNKKTKEKFKSEAVNKLTISFWWRRINFDNKPYGILKLTKTTKNVEDYLKITYDNNDFIVEGLVGIKTKLIVPQDYEKNEIFDWLHLTVTYDILENNLTAFVINAANKRTINKFVNLNQKNNGGESGIVAHPTGEDTYQLTVGLEDTGISTAFAFEIASIILTPNVIMNSDTADKFRLRKPTKCEDPCFARCTVNQVCEADQRITQPLNLSDPEMASGILDADDLKNRKLFRMLGEMYKGFAQSQSQNYYLISFELDVGAFLNNPYLINKDILFTMTNFNQDNVKTLTMGDLLPENSFEFAAFAVEHRNGNLRVYVGSNEGTGSTNHYEVNLNGGLKSYKRVYLAILIDVSRSYAKMNIFLDDLQVPYDLKADLSTPPQLIFGDTLVYNHPAVGNVRLNVHNPRFDYDYEKYLYTSSSYSNNTPNTANVCTQISNSNCSKCFIRVADNSTSCQRCFDGFRLLGDDCLSQITVSPVSKKQNK